MVFFKGWLKTKMTSDKKKDCWRMFEGVGKNRGRDKCIAAFLDYQKSFIDLVFQEWRLYRGSSNWYDSGEFHRYISPIEEDGATVGESIKG